MKYFCGGIIKILIAITIGWSVVPIFIIAMVYEIGRGYKGSHPDLFHDNPIWRPFQVYADWTPFEKVEYFPEDKK